MLNKSQVSKLKKGYDKNKKLSVIFNALSDVGRMQIFKIFLEREDVCVSDISKIIDVSVPAASRQLTILEQAGMIEKVRKGQMICFRVMKKDKTVRSIIEIIKKSTNNN